MNQYNPIIHHRRSIRLKEYDYANEGLYFVTICVQNRICLFGDVKNGEMVLNDAGRMVERWYYETQNRFPDIVCHEMVLMPNHFHCIWENVGADICVRPGNKGKYAVGADLCVRPNQTWMDTNLGADTQVRPYEDDKSQFGSPLSKVVQWFKTMSTNEYIRGVEQLKWPPFDRRLWQRNYYEHIIRNDLSYHDIANYIMSNPLRWNEDQFYPY